MWYEDSDKWRCAVELWLRGNLCEGKRLTWQAMHSRPLACLSNNDDDDDDKECLVQVFDGAGTGHLLRIKVNSGCADANTGIFGRVWSSEGVWALIKGYAPGDCATLVEATSLALKRYKPHYYHTEADDNDDNDDNIQHVFKDAPPLSHYLPISLFFNAEENTFKNGAEIEAVLLVLGYLCMREVGGFFCFFLLPSSFSVNVFSDIHFINLSFPRSPLAA